MRKTKTNEAQLRKQADSIRQRGLEQMAEHDLLESAKRNMQHKSYQAAVILQKSGEKMERIGAIEWITRTINKKVDV